MDRLLLQKFQNTREEIPGAVKWIQRNLEKKKLSRKDVLKTLLAAEQVLENLAAYGEEGSQVTIWIKSR